MLNFGKAAAINAAASAFLTGPDSVPSDVTGYVMPSAGFLKSIGVATVLVGTGNDGNVVVHIDGVATSLSATVEGSSAGLVTTTANAANGLAVNAGQRIAVKASNVSGGPTSFNNTTATVQITLS